MTSEKLANLLGATAVALSDRLEEATVRVTGLRGEASAAVLTVGSRSGRPVEHLRRTLGLSHSGTVRLVDRLEERGWVERRDGVGGREVLLELTSAGGTVLRALLEARRDVLDRALSGVGEGDRDILERSLSDLLSGLPARREDAWRICRLCEHGVCRGEECPVGSAVDRRTAEEG